MEEVIVNSITAIATAIITVIVMLQIQRRHRHIDGHIVVTENGDGKKVFSLELNKNPDDLEKEEFIVFKVVEEVEPDEPAE